MADFTEIRNELRDFYGTKLDGLHNENIEKCLNVLDNGIPKDIPAIIQKKMQYKLLADNVHPVLFRNTVLFGEVCANKAIECSDTIGNYTLNINKELYHKLAADVFDARNEAQSYPLYMFCGEFGDEKYHFAFNNEKILKQGFKGIYERVMARLNESNLPDDERLWLEAVKEATLAVKNIAEAFTALANKKAEGSADSNEREHYLTVAELSSRIPWEKPETFVEALCTVQFIQSVVPFLEGGGLYSVGRLDLMLIDFYRHDIDKGILTPDEAEKLIGEFLLLHDMRIPHEQENQRDSLVNACYTLGGIDRKGNYVFNELTRAFLKLDNEIEIIYPKIKCRYDKGSPKEYLDLINTELKNGKSTLLYQNDSAIIPSFINSGVDSEDARDYSILGCWEPVIPGATNEHCSYFLTLKIFELSVYGGIKTSNFEILPLEEAKSFDEVLAITLKNIHGVMESRCHVAVTARPHWYEVDPHPLLSSVVDDCIERGKDITNGGTKYSFDEIICAGLPNVIDSLLAIKELCFDTKKIHAYAISRCGARKLGKHGYA